MFDMRTPGTTIIERVFDSTEIAVLVGNSSAQRLTAFSAILGVSSLTMLRFVRVLLRSSIAALKTQRELALENLVLSENRIVLQLVLRE